RSFPDRFRNFVRFSETYADRSIVIAGHNQRTEAEASTAFHNFRAAVDEHDFLGRVASCRRRSVLMTGIRSSALSWPALSVSWCCHEIKTLIHLRGPRRPALLLCLDIEIRRGRTRPCRSFFQARARQSLCRQLQRSCDWRRLYFSQARPSRRSTLRLTSCPRRHRSPARTRACPKSRSTIADAPTSPKFSS